MTRMQATEQLALRGVLTVLPTPFDDAGQVDYKSLERVVNHVVREGSAGVVLFGLASELYKLTDAERNAILSVVRACLPDSVPLIAGSEANSIEAACARAHETVALGADALMVLPPSFVKPDEETIEAYYTEVAAAANGRPLVIQDAPGWTQVPMTVELMARVRDRAPNVQYVKIESPPNAPKIVAANEAGLKVIGGYGLLHFLQDAQAGVVAVMPGAGLVSLMVELWKASRQDPEAAWTLYSQLLPVLTFQMSNLDVFIACQKALLHQRGVIASERPRRPGRALTPDERAWLWFLLRSIEWEGSPSGV